MILKVSKPLNVMKTFLEGVHYDHNFDLIILEKKLTSNFIEVQGGNEIAKYWKRLSKCMEM